MYPERGVQRAQIRKVFDGCQVIQRQANMLKQSGIDSYKTELRPSVEHLRCVAEHGKLRPRERHIRARLLKEVNKTSAIIAR